MGTGLILIIFSGLLIPEIPIFLPKSGDLIEEEKFCARSAARIYVYNQPWERFFIRGEGIRTYGREPFVYKILPVTFYGLPWPAAIVRCSLDSKGYLRPQSGRLEKNVFESAIMKRR